MVEDFRDADPLGGRWLGLGMLARFLLEVPVLRAPGEGYVYAIAASY